MENLIFSIGKINIFWNAVLITAGVAGCYLIAKKLLKKNDAAVVFTALSLVISLFICRFFDFYVSVGKYESFWKAFTDYSKGTFCMPGIILGTWLAASITKSLGYIKKTGTLLDAAAPGLCLVAAAVRLGAFFTRTCYGKKNITSTFIQKLPISMALTDDAGNTYYRFATWFVEAVLMIVLMIVVVRLHRSYSKAKMIPPCKTRGNVWKLFLVFYGVIEILMEATRRDAQNIYFRLLLGLNQFSNFISLAQVVSMICIVYVFVYYFTGSVRINGFGREQIVLLALFVISLVGIGYLGEYCLQRHDFKALSYISMVVSGIAISAIVFKTFSTCLYYEEE